MANSIAEKVYDAVIFLNEPKHIYDLRHFLMEEDIPRNEKTSLSAALMMAIDNWNSPIYGFEEILEGFLNETDRDVTAENMKELEAEIDAMGSYDEVLLFLADRSFFFHNLECAA